MPVKSKGSASSVVETNPDGGAVATANGKKSGKVTPVRAPIRVLPPTKGRPIPVAGPKPAPEAVPEAPPVGRIRKAKVETKAAPEAVQEPEKAPGDPAPKPVDPGVKDFVGPVPAGPLAIRVNGDEISHLPPMNEEELGRREFLDGYISERVQSTWELGEALAEVKARVLFRNTHDTFADYVKGTHTYSLRKANYLISAVNIRGELEQAGETELPDSEAVSRPLASVPSGDRVEVWKAAKEVAKAEGKSKPEGKHVAAAAEYSGKKRGRPKGIPNDFKGDRAKPEVDPKVQAAVNDGRIPEGAVIETTFTSDDEEKVTPANTSDDEWLDGFPIRDQLTVNTRRVFDAEALGYRAIEAERVAFVTKVLSPAIAKAKAATKGLGPYLGMIQWALKLPHPSQWKLCASCKGAGEVKGVGACTDCRRSGFQV